MLIFDYYHKCSISVIYFWFVCVLFCWFRERFETHKNQKYMTENTTFMEISKNEHVFSGKETAKQ